MKLNISPTTTIAAIQEEFQDKYPHLSLRFFQKGHGEHKATHSKFLYNDTGLRLSAISPDLKQGEIDITPTVSTWSVEKTFEEKFGLHVQVFRQQGALWLETSTSDDWTLEKQNRVAYNSLHQDVDDETDIDYREQA